MPAKKQKHVDKDARRTLATNVRRGLEDTGMNQVELARRCPGLHQQRISTILSQEQGASIDTIALLAKALRRPLYEMLISPDEAYKLRRSAGREQLIPQRPDRPSTRPESGKRINK